jgi:hypothetical protein
MYYCMGQDLFNCCEIRNVIHQQLLSFSTVGSMEHVSNIVANLEIRYIQIGYAYIANAFIEYTRTGDWKI